MRYAPAGGTAGYAGYYGTSELDHFLNNEFFYLFSDDLQAIIVNSEIEITAEHSLQAGANNELEIIERRVFLLSMTETGNASARRRRMSEGDVLAYFSTDERIPSSPRVNNGVAYRSDGEPGIWWLRTPLTNSNPDEAGVINHTGVQSTVHFNSAPGSDASTHLGVRPAFCLPSNTLLRQGELGGEMVFFMIMDKQKSDM
jgi:hypothetical protein